MADRQVTEAIQRTAARTRAAPWPGAWGAAATTALSAVACWLWLLPQLTERPSEPGAGTVASELAEVGEADLTGALSTMDIPSATVARLKQDARECGAKLAWVTLARPGAKTAQTIRIRSGAYFSSVLTVTDAPVRVAIPYPAPYATGHGTLTVLGAQADLIVALTPAWHIPANAATAAHDVTWRPQASCTRP